MFNSTEFLQGKSSEFYLVIPHLYRDANAIRAIIDREYVFNLEIMAWIHPHYKIENIYGSYFDIYNNAIYSECRNNIINLWGAGVKIKILNCIIAKTMNIVCRDQSTVFIEKNIKFMGILTINMSMGAELHLKQGSVFDGQIYLLSQVPLGKIIIGQEAWIETGVKIFSGDGHAICDLKYGRDKYYVNKDLSLLEVIIGAHCLIGRGANLINCKVGQGTIIYPISLVTKKIPNNCICAGVPARVIRRDIAWSREINCYDMNDSLFGVPDEYKHLTGIFDV